MVADLTFDFSADPFVNFERELNNARSSASAAAGVREPTAMTLATASKDGVPEARIVLFKGLLRGGLSFYTNYESAKAGQLDENPKATLLFYWAPLFRQVRIRGRIEKTTRAESEAYFNSRARLSQLGAWASPQSETIASYQALEDRLREIEKKFADQAVIPCPPHWGGYLLFPEQFEFWIGRDGRLHERYVYVRDGETWQRSMRAP